MRALGMPPTRAVVTRHLNRFAKEDNCIGIDTIAAVACATRSSVCSTPHSWYKGQGSGFAGPGGTWVTVGVVTLPWDQIKVLLAWDAGTTLTLGGYINGRRHALNGTQ